MSSHAEMALDLRIVKAELETTRAERDDLRAGVEALISDLACVCVHLGLPSDASVDDMLTRMDRLAADALRPYPRPMGALEAERVRGITRDHGGTGWP